MNHIEAVCDPQNRFPWALWKSFSYHKRKGKIKNKKERHKKSKSRVSLNPTQKHKLVLFFIFEQKVT